MKALEFFRDIATNWRPSVEKIWDYAESIEEVCNNPSDEEEFTKLLLSSSMLQWHLLGSFCFCKSKYVIDALRNYVASTTIEDLKNSLNVTGGRSKIYPFFLLLAANDAEAEKNFVALLKDETIAIEGKIWVIEILRETYSEGAERVFNRLRGQLIDPKLNTSTDFARLWMRKEMRMRRIEMLEERWKTHNQTEAEYKELVELDEQAEADYDEALALGLKIY